MRTHDIWQIVYRRIRISRSVDRRTSSVLGTRRLSRWFAVVGISGEALACVVHAGADGGVFVLGANVLQPVPGTGPRHNLAVGRVQETGVADARIGGFAGGDGCRGDESRVDGGDGRYDVASSRLRRPRGKHGSLVPVVRVLQGRGSRGYAG